MIGLNDNTSETFTAADVDTLTSYVKSNGLAGLHFWSFDRDTPCSSATGYASPTCNSVSGTTRTGVHQTVPHRPRGLTQIPGRAGQELPCPARFHLVRLGRPPSPQVNLEGAYCLRIRHCPGNLIGLANC